LIALGVPLVAAFWMPRVAHAHGQDALVKMGALSLLPSVAGADVQLQGPDVHPLLGWEFQFTGRKFLDPEARHRGVVSPVLDLQALSVQLRLGYRYAHPISSRLAWSVGLGLGVLQGPTADAEVALRLMGRVFWWFVIRPELDIDHPKAVGAAAIVGWSFF
jgi:hypothetical protein